MEALLSLTLAKASLATAILGILLGRLKPLPMAAILVAAVVAQMIYIDVRWNREWYVIALTFATLFTVGEFAYLLSAFLMMKR